MAIEIRDGKLYGDISGMKQFLHGTPQCGDYMFKVTFDGTPFEQTLPLLLDKLSIRQRPKTKTLEQAKALANGVAFESVIGRSVQQVQVIKVVTLENMDSCTKDEAEAVMAQLKAKYGLE